MGSTISDCGCHWGVAAVQNVRHIIAGLPHFKEGQQGCAAFIGKRPGSCMCRVQATPLSKLQ